MQKQFKHSSDTVFDIIYMQKEFKHLNHTVFDVI